MKKVMFLPVFLMIGMMSNAWADGYVGGLQAYTCGGGGNEYLNIGNGQCVECDTKSGYQDAPGGTRAYYYYNKNGYAIAYKECKITGGGDYWTNAVGVAKCSNNTCTNGRIKPIPEVSNYSICVPNNFNTQTLGDSVFVNGGSGVCYLEGAGASSGVSKCPTTGGYAQLNAVLDGSCNNTKSVASKLESYENLVEGASCKFKCAANGWYVYLKDGSCKSGFEPSADKRKCVSTVEGNMCRHTGGEWNSGIQQCTCSASLQLTNDGPTKCKCSKSGYSWDYENKKCVNSSGRSYNEQISVDNTNRSAKQKRDACVASGGSMPKSTCICDAAKFMQVSGGVCTCMSGYEWVSAGSPSQGCKITDAETVKRACTAATNGTWDASTQKCVCNDADYELDVNAQTCKPISALAECQPLMAQNKARWDATNKTCKCTQEGYALEDGECKETAEGAVARKANEMQTAKSKIENVHSKLKKTQDGFKVSAWKNEDGNFNTARLASDATAGVVLGTAGALITSKIVKKNQIEDGFEDIRCTIGGQSVAGWGDEFSVGNQM